MLDALIKGGVVIDGTGTAARRADVGIADGKVAFIGHTDDPAATVLDADGLVVCPGFIDVHTHYDAQLMWDPYATPSCFHGVTTVIGGNCGFGVAPLAPSDSDYILEMLAVVEGMPSQALRDGLSWDWASFGQWLDRFEGQLGVNAGFLAGHSVIRRLVMGNGVRASQDQIASMVRVLHESLDAGALGFSSSWAPTHVDGNTQPVPSRAAGKEELVALATATGQHPGTTLAFIPGIPPFSPEQTNTLIEMSAAADRPINWNTFRVTSQDPAIPEGRLEYAAAAQQRGARVVALAFPVPAEFLFTFASPTPLTGLPGWSHVMGLQPDLRMRALADTTTRRQLETQATAATGQLADLANWGTLEVARGFSPDTESLVGQTIGTIAARNHTSPFDTILDLALADQLRTVFSVRGAGDDDQTWRIRSQYWDDPRTVIGGSDAGAHLDVLCGARYTTDFLAKAVSQRGLLSLEQAVRLLTDAPARFLGLRDRGRLAAGCAADVVLLDPDAVDPGAITVASDLPGDASRLVSKPTGIEAVLVNGVETVRGGHVTGKLPGTVLRSFRDCSTVTAR